MQASKLIEQLQSILKYKGDFQVLVETGDGQPKNIDSISNTEIEGNMYIIINPKLSF